MFMGYHSGFSQIRGGFFVACIFAALRLGVGSWDLVSLCLDRVNHIAIGGIGPGVYICDSWIYSV